jgi:hypothetical protein
MSASGSIRLAVDPAARAPRRVAHALGLTKIIASPSRFMSASGSIRLAVDPAARAPRRVAHAASFIAVSASRLPSAMHRLRSSSVSGLSSLAPAQWLAP